MSSTQLEFNVDGDNLTAPLSFEDIRAVSLVTHDYAASDTDGGDVKLKKGFFFKGTASGTYECITLYQWKRGVEAYTGTVSNPITDGQRNLILQAIKADGKSENIYIVDGQWTDTPIIFIEKTSAASTAINIGLY